MRSNIYKIISGILFPIVFVSLFFAIGGTAHGATCWIGFASLLLSYVMLIFVPLLIPNSQSAYLFGIANGTITSIFFFIQFIVSLTFIIFDFKKWKISLIIEIALFVIMILFSLQLLQSNEATAKNEKIHNKEVYSVKKLAFKAKMIFDNTTDHEIKKYAKSIYDELSTCQTSGNTQVIAIDESIRLNLDRLNQYAIVGDVNSVKAVVLSLKALIKQRKFYLSKGD